MALGALIATPAQARSVRQFSIPAGSLSGALLVYAQQAGVSISISDALKISQRTGGLKGRYEISDALRRLLKGSGLTFTFVDPTTVRIGRISTPPPRPAVRPVAPAPSKPPPMVSAPDIVVIGTKQRATLAEYPASISILQLTPADTARGGADGTSAVLNHVPGLASTNLGPGRNKVFIRGIADSSFNGESQATISQYLGDARLIYSAPDPNLLLYDIERVEVLEGPQGTLYGAGTLGGIIQLVPRAPDLESASGGVSAGLRLTQHGAPGFDASAVANLPIVSDRLAARVVAYGSQEGGYIDDTLRRLSNINRNRITGVRAGLRWKPASDWTIDLGLVSQNISSRDGQYADTAIGTLSRASAIAQPFDNDYRMVNIAIKHAAGATELVSSTSYARQNYDTTFDATRIPGVSAPRIYSELNDISLLAHETRASGQFNGRGRWIVGVSALFNQDRSSRELGLVDRPQMLASVTNDTLDTALFGEGTWPLFRHLDVTLGGRLSYVRQVSKLAGAEDRNSESRRTQFRGLPSAAVSWRRTNWLIYARYQEGYRPGALQISGLGGRLAAERFERDHISTVELGMRFGVRPGSRLTGSIVGANASWDDIQADLVNLQGLPYTANIGSGTVHTLSAQLAWKPRPNVSIDASGFVTASNLSELAPDYASVRNRDLPNIADAGWRLAATYDHDLGRAHLWLDAAVRYNGNSRLAVREPFDLPQGGFYDASIGGRLALGNLGFSLDFSNLFDSRANTFAFGNPFSLAGGTQTTPLRPRSVRFGIDATF